MGKLAEHIGEKIGEKLAHEIKLGSGLYAVDILQKFASKASEKHLAAVIKGFEENSNENHFILKRDSKGSYTIYDKNFHEKYIVNEKLSIFKHYLSIFNASNKKEIGRIKEVFSLRAINPFSDLSCDFELFLENKSIGAVLSGLGFLKQKVNLTYHDYEVDTNFFEDKFLIKNKDNLDVIKVKYDYRLDAFIIHSLKSEDELVCLMTILTLNCVSKKNGYRNFKHAYKDLLGILSPWLFVLIGLILYLIFVK